LGPIGMTHRYVRRTYDEAEEVAKSAFRDAAASNLTTSDLEELRVSGAVTGGTPGSDWQEVIGHEATDAARPEADGGLFQVAAELHYLHRQTN
jgi:uncharacterized protein YgfB (UPF0149 family)